MFQPDAENMNLSDALSAFHREGYARLGMVFQASFINTLSTRAASLLSRETSFPGMFYQHDSPTGSYTDLRFNAGWVGPSSRYRKVESLEQDPVFLDWMQNALFERIVHTLLGAPVTLYRSVLWNKAPRVGMAVPWHQDDGKFWGLDRPPSVQIWTALDDAPIDAGPLEVVPGSHLRGLASPEGGTITDSALKSANAEENHLSLPAQRGECILIHNHTWHRTARNRTDHPRKAISLSFLSADTRCTRTRRAPRTFLPMFARD